MVVQRQALHAYVSGTALEAWRNYCEGNGVSLTSVLEAIGIELDEALTDLEADEIRPDWVKRARTIDAKRRRRGS